MKRGVVATAAGLLGSTRGRPGPAPAQSPHSHTGNFVKELFPDRSCPGNSGWAQSEAAGAQGKGVVLAAKFISESRQRWLLLLGTLIAGIQNYRLFPPPSLGACFLLTLLLLCFVILGDVSSVFKLWPCCPSHFAPFFPLLPSLRWLRSPLLLHPCADAVVTTTAPRLPLPGKFGLGLWALASAAPVLLRS